jgi:hypothetical protein
VIKLILKNSLILLVVLLAGCSLFGINQWSAYKVIIDVQDQTGHAVENAVLESNDVKTQTTDESGQTQLRFKVAGLHVVTITAENKITKQIKIGLPQDDNKIIQVILKDKIQ